MPFNDLREFVQLLEERGELVRIKKEIGSGHEIFSMQWEMSERKGGPAFLAENVKGYDIPILANTFGTLDRWALACGLPTGRSEMEYRDMVSGIMDPKNFVKPKRVETGPCKEVILKGDDIDLDKFPILQWHPYDGGRYITMGLVVTEDDRFGRNVGLYRMMMKDKRTLAMLVSMVQDIGIHMGRAIMQNKETIPCTAVIGADPAIYEAAVTKIDLRADEFSFAAAFRGGEPIEVVKCETNDLEVPATAEIVLEGELTVKERTKEGPYCEYFGYAEEEMMNPLFKVKCVTHRKDPLFISTTIGHMHSEEELMRLIVQRATFLRLCKQRITGFVNVHLPAAGRGLSAVVSINKRQPGYGKHAIIQAYAIPMVMATVNNIIIVDEDIDVTNLDDVFWAMSTRVDPERDVVLFPPAGVHPLNPAARIRPISFPPTGITDVAICSKMGIDATLKKFGELEGHYRPVPKPVKPDPEVWKMVKENWKEYGFE